MHGGICLERCLASLYIDSQVGVYMSPSRLQVGVLVLRLKSWASRLIPSCWFPRVGLWRAASHDTHQVPSRSGFVGVSPRQGLLVLPILEAQRRQNREKIHDAGFSS